LCNVVSNSHCNP